MLEHSSDDLETLFADRFAEMEKAAQTPIGGNSPIWYSQAPGGAGVYLIYRENRLVYCGETHSLKRRFADLGRTVNHTWRRTLGNLILRDFDGFQRASSRTKFLDQHEKILDRHVQSYGVRFTEISLGRKEFESWVIRTQTPIFNRENSKCAVSLAYIAALQNELNSNYKKR